MKKSFILFSILILSATCAPHLLASVNDNVQEQPQLCCWVQQDPINYALPTDPQEAIHYLQTTADFVEISGSCLQMKRESRRIGRRQLIEKPHLFHTMSMARFLQLLHQETPRLVQAAITVNPAMRTQVIEAIFNLCETIKALLPVTGLNANSSASGKRLRGNGERFEHEYGAARPENCQCSSDASVSKFKSALYDSSRRYTNEDRRNRNMELYKFLQAPLQVLPFCQNCLPSARSVAADALEFLNGGIECAKGIEQLECSFDQLQTDGMRAFLNREEVEAEE